MLNERLIVVQIAEYIMLLKTSQDSLKKVFHYVSKFPFAKQALHRLNEAARGKSVVFFSMHKIVENDGLEEYIDPSALDIKKAAHIIKEINKTLPFISMRDAIDILKGEQKLTCSHGVLILEVPYIQSIKTILPVLKEMHVPLCVMLSTHSIYSGELLWMDEVIYRLSTTHKTNISVSYIDRSFPLVTFQDRQNAATHFVEHLSHCHPHALEQKLNELKDNLDENSLPSPNERIATVAQLKEFAKNPLVLFGSAGQFHWPFYEIGLDEAAKEITAPKEELSALFDTAFVPVFSCPLGFDKRRNQELVNMMIASGYQAAISRTTGICHPGDNMFRLMRLPLGPNTKSFEQYQLMGLSDAIDEFLLVTLAKDREF